MKFFPEVGIRGYALTCYASVVAIGVSMGMRYDSVPVAILIQVVGFILVRIELNLMALAAGQAAMARLACVSAEMRLAMMQAQLEGDAAEEPKHDRVA